MNINIVVVVVVVVWRDPMGGDVGLVDGGISNRIAQGKQAIEQADELVEQDVEKKNVTLDKI